MTKWHFSGGLRLLLWAIALAGPTLEHSATAGQPGSLVAWGSLAGSAGQPVVNPMPPFDLGPIIDVAAGDRFVVAVKPDGTVVAWGDNTFNQTDVPSTATNVIAVAGGEYHAVALRGDGTVITWGDRGLYPPPAGLSGVTAISSGLYHNLALRTDGTVVAWGFDGDGEADVPAGLNNVVAIAAGAYHSLALKKDGSIVGWGSADFGQLTTPAHLTNVVAIAAAGFASMALRADGTVAVWGNNRDGQTNVPADLGGVAAIAGGTYHCVALRSDGTVAAWGSDIFGQSDVPAGLRNVLGIRAALGVTLAITGPSNQPVVHPATATAVIFNGFVVGVQIVDPGFGYTNAPSVQIIGGGGEGAIATAVVSNEVVTAIDVFDAGRGYTSLPQIVIGAPRQPPTGPLMSIEASGFRLATQVVPGARYQLFDSFDGQTWMPVNPPFVAQSSNVVQNVEAATTGPFYQLRLSRPSHVVGWLFRNGQPGFDADLFENAIAVAGRVNSVVDALSEDMTYQGITNVIAIYSDAFAFAALRRDGTIVASDPPAPAGLSGIRGVSLSTYGLGVKGDGTVVGWGSGAATNIPPGLTDVASVSANYDFALALKRDGTVVAWGDNSFSQTDVPPGLRDVIAISASYSHTLALRSDGTVVAWGNNTNGQSTVPSGLNNVKMVRAGDGFSAALKNDGTVAVWGSFFNAAAFVPDWATNIASIAVAADASPAYILALSTDGSVNRWGPNWETVPPPFPASFGYATSIYTDVADALAIVDDVSPPRPALAAPQLTNGFLVGINLLNGGFGYTNPPSVQIAGGGGSGAQAEAIFTDGVVTGFVIVDAGRGYTSAPDVIVAPPSGYIPPPPPVTIEPAQVALHMSVTAGNTYQLLSSTNLLTWTPAGPAFVAQTDSVIQEFAISGAGQFFKLLETP